MDTLYNRIEKIGKLHGYKNMTALCKAAGVPRANMSELKMGRSAGISLNTAQKFAILMNLSVDYLLGNDATVGNADAKKEPATDGDGLSAIKREAIEELSKCSDAEAQMFLDILFAVKKKNPADQGGAGE